MQTHTQAYTRHSNTKYSFVYVLFNPSLSAHAQIQPEKQFPHHMEMGVFKSLWRRVFSPSIWEELH